MATFKARLFNSQWPAIVLVHAMISIWFVYVSTFKARLYDTRWPAFVLGLLIYVSPQ